MRIPGWKISRKVIVGTYFFMLMSGWSCTGGSSGADCSQGCDSGSSGGDGCGSGSSSAGDSGSCDSSCADPTPGASASSSCDDSESSPSSSGDEPPEATIVFLRAAPATAAPGDTITVLWSSLNASSCTLAGNSVYLDSVGPSGILHYQIAETTTYSLTCLPGGARVTSTVTVGTPLAQVPDDNGILASGTGVRDLPPAATRESSSSFRADPPLILTGQRSTLRWQGVPGDTCRVTPAAGTGESGQTEETVQPPETTNYFLQCGSFSDPVPLGSVAVEVLPKAVDGFTAEPVARDLPQPVDFAFSGPNELAVLTEDFRIIWLESDGRTFQPVRQTALQFPPSSVPLALQTDGQRLFVLIRETAPGLSPAAVSLYRVIPGRGPDWMQDTSAPRELAPGTTEWALAIGEATGQPEAVATGMVSSGTYRGTLYPPEALNRQFRMDRDSRALMIADPYWDHIRIRVNNVDGSPVRHLKLGPDGLLYLLRGDGGILERLSYRTPGR